MRQKALLVLQFVLLIVFTGDLYAQTTQASFTGKVTDSENKPLAGASVLVKNESTGFSSTTLTNAKGDYVFKELPLGGPYHILVSFVGMADLKKPGYTLNQGDVVTVNFELLSKASEYSAVTVTANRGKGKIENLGAATAVGSRLLGKMPINGRNFTTLMDLSPLSRGGNIAGQLGSSTNYTIDGMNAKNSTSAGSTTSRSGAPYSISIEAVREFKVVTNQYDVTYGRSGGGTVRRGNEIRYQHALRFCIRFRPCRLARQPLRYQGQQKEAITIPLTSMASHSAVPSSKTNCISL